MSKKYKSIILWPDTVSTGQEPNESVDYHDSLEQARAVCRMIMRDGLGGERKIFPLSVRVEYE